MVSKDMFEMSHEEAKPKMTATLGVEEILAWDPGASGGYAFFHHSGLRVYEAPATAGDVLTLIGEITDACEGNKKVAIVESQSGFSPPGQQVAATRMFTFGKGYGFTLGVLQALGWKIIEVTPQKWQKYLGVGSKKDHGTKTEWKHHLKAKAQQLFPGTKITLKTADALLILEWYMRSKTTITPMASFFS